jgi:hypothetical protein
MKVITFSRNFPATHPRKGEPTHFVEKIVKGLNQIQPPQDISSPFIEEMYYIVDPKHHTIRAGNRWKEGEYFSPRVWSDKPYASKQIQFAQPIQIKKIWSFDIVRGYMFINRKCYGKFHPFNTVLQQLAKNDGLTVIEMVQWFSVHPKAKNLTFKGQILCWNDSIDYSNYINS